MRLKGHFPKRNTVRPDNNRNPNFVRKWHIRVETPIALHSVAHRVSHQIPAESEMSRQNRATPPKSRCRTFLRTPLSHFPLIRSRQGARRAGGGYRGTFGFRKRIALQGGIAATVTPVALLYPQEKMWKKMGCVFRITGTQFMHYVAHLKRIGKQFL